MAKQLSEVLVSVRNMEVTFGSKRKKFVAVRGVSFDIYKGETFGLVGESGSGKTTIGRAIIRINPMSNGEVIFKGEKISGKISKELDKRVTQQIQMIFQDPMASLNERAKVDYIVSEGLQNVRHDLTKEQRTEMVSKALLEVGLLPEFASRFPHEFSGGQRQRIGIARSLIMEPEFIIADEPISALDVSIRAQVMNLLSYLQKERGLTYLFIAHDMSVNEAVASVDKFGRITCLSEGETVITVSLTDRNGKTYTDSVTVNVLAAVGDLRAFLSKDDTTGYFDFWLTVPDYAPEKSVVGKSAINLYSIRAGEYFDGDFYGYTGSGNFVRVSATDPADYSVLGSWNLTKNGDKVVDMAFDYTTGTMYALTLSYDNFYDSTVYRTITKYGDLMKVNLKTGELTYVATMDAMVNTLAVGYNGTLYAAGSSDSTQMTADIYTVVLQGETAHCTDIGNIPAPVSTMAYGSYNPQMTYDYASNRLYLKSTGYVDYTQIDGGLYMIQLNESGGASAVTPLGKIGLYSRGASKVTNAYLGMLCAIPDENDLPEGGYVSGVVLNRHAARLLGSENITLTARVQPSNAADKSVRWESSDENVATVDQYGVVTAVGVGTAIIKEVSNFDPTISDSCTVTVIEDTAGTTAYAITIEKGLIAFDPEAPNSYTKIADIKDAANVAGMDVDGADVYYLTNIGGWAALYRYNMDTKLTTLLGQIQTFTTNISDMAYDPTTESVYVACDLYVYQYYVPALRPDIVPNTYSAFTLAKEEYEKSGTAYGITVTAEGKVYALCKDQFGEFVMEVTNGATGLACDYLGNIDGLSTDQGSTEFAYNGATGRFYVTNAASQLFTFALGDLYNSKETTASGVAEAAGDVAGLSVTGLTIVKSPSAAQLAAWAS